MYFTGISSLEELKKRYRDLAMEMHPDKGGDTRAFQDMQNEYETAFERVSNGDDMTDAFMVVMDGLVVVPGIEIEVCGSWIWVDGNTYPNRATFKDMGLFWASKKKKWYWRPAEQKRKRGKEWSMEKIREKFGSERRETAEVLYIG